MQRQTDMAKLTDKFLQLSVMNMHKNTTTGIQNTNNLSTWSTGSKIETEEGTGACTSPHAMHAHIPTHTRTRVHACTCACAHTPTERAWKSHKPNSFP
jgi:hypothetical protein